MADKMGNQPLGMKFMEPTPSDQFIGSYDTAKHMFVDSTGKPVIANSATTTGSNASTGAWPEQDQNEDYD